LIIAVPADVNCAVPTIAGLSQRLAVALQNVTRPLVSATLELFDTAAVNITTVPAVTEEDDSVRVVVVAAPTTSVTLAVAVV
jgi:hypothetical protein